VTLLNYSLRYINNFIYLSIYYSHCLHTNPRWCGRCGGLHWWYFLL